MSKTSPTSVKLEEWPVLDRELWHAATHKGDFLDPDGKAATLVRRHPASKLKKAMASGSSILTAEGAASSSEINAAY